MNENKLTEKDYDQIERILDKFMSLPTEKQEIVLKEADKILNEDKSDS